MHVFNIQFPTVSPIIRIELVLIENGQRQHILRRSAPLIAGPAHGKTGNQEVGRAELPQIGRRASGLQLAEAQIPAADRLGKFLEVLEVPVDEKGSNLIHLFRD